MAIAISYISYLLHSDQVRFDERNVVIIFATEHADDTSMIDSGRQDGEKIIQQIRLLLQVEHEGLVVAIARDIMRFSS